MPAAGTNMAQLLSKAAGPVPAPVFPARVQASRLRSFAGFFFSSFPCLFFHGCIVAFCSHKSYETRLMLVFCTILSTTI